jgi:RNA polymerase sigma-70 factor (ECF subfamily)
MERADDPATAAIETWLAGDRRDPGAFEAVYRAHVGRVHALCRRLAGRPEAAEEMVQEVFVRAFTHRHDFHSAEHFASWCRRVAINLETSRRRTRSRWGRTVAFEETGPTVVAFTRPVPVGAGSDLDQAIAALPDGARRVFVLHDVLGMKHDEVAEIVGTATATTKVQLHRARKRLRELLGR